MNYGSEPADQVVRYSLEGAEFALRISGTAAKNFFIFAQAVLHDSKKTHGKTHLIRLLKEQKPLKFFTVDKDRMHDFARAAKAHGLLFCPIRDKMDPDHIEIAILQDDASKANRIIDKLQLAIVDTGTAELIDTVQQERSEPTPETERVQTEDGGHRAGLCLAGGLHGQSTFRYEFQAVFERERSGDHEGREFA